MQEFPLPSLPVCGKGGKLRRKWNEIADGIYKNLNEKNRDTSSWKSIQFHSEIIILRTRREQDTVSTLKYVTFQVRPLELKDSLRYNFLPKCNNRCLKFEISY